MTMTVTMILTMTLMFSEMTVPGGYLLDEDKLTSSQFITDLIARGRKYMSLQVR